MTEDNDGSVEILVPDDVVVPPVEPKVDKPAGEAEPKPEVSAEEGIDIVKANLLASQENERTLRGQLTEAQRATNETARIAEAARTGEHEANLTMVTNAIATLEERRDNIEGQLATAYANQDHAAAAKCNVAIADIAAKLNTLRAGAQQLKDAPPPKVEVPSAPVNKVEALARQMSPESASWVRSHPDYVNDDMKFQEMLAAHNLVTARGTQADTPEYFEKIETILGIRDATAAEPRRQSAPAAAPVSRGTSIANGGDNHRTVRLTAEEREIAKLSGLTDVQYAQQKLRIEAERVTQH